MALSFSNSNGAAKKGIEYFKLEDGMNQFRILPDSILAMYSYWLPSTEGKNKPFECLSFDRDQEKFTNLETDWCQHYFPDIRCGWAYACQVVDTEGNIKVLTLKKKMYQQILEAADDLGDPTDLVNGWDCMVMRKKTGPLAYNVEYTLQVLKCKPSAVSKEVIEAWEEGAKIDALIPRPTAEDQQKAIKAACLKEGEANKDEVATEEFDDDIPF